MLLDAHVHTDKYSQDIFENVVKECQVNDIKLLSVSMCIDSYNIIKKLSQKYDFIIPSFGVHPWSAKLYSNNLTILDDYLLQNKYIGEIGLDKKFLKYADPYIDQLKVFEYITSSPLVKGKLLNLHTSGAEVEVLKYLEAYKHSKFLVHWYAGELKIIDRYLALGGFFTIGVEVLFSKHIEDIATLLPLDRILIETDNPSSYSWLLGKEQNNGMPSLLYKVIDKICLIKKISKEEFLYQLEINQKAILA